MINVKKFLITVIKECFRMLQSIGDQCRKDEGIVILSQKLISDEDRNEFLKRIGFFVPSLLEKVVFKQSPALFDIFSSKPILIAGNITYFISKLTKIREGIFNVDFRTNPMDGWEWCKLAGYVDKKHLDEKDAKRNFISALNKCKEQNLDKCYIYGTGTSLAKAIDRDWSDGYRVVCNTIVRDSVLWRHINPHFIVAGDAIYHFGFTEFARSFRADLAKRLRETDTYFLYPQQFDVIVRREINEFSERLIPVPQGIHEIIHKNMTKEFVLPKLGNVLNLLLLPLACTLSKNIYLWGFNGRAPDDKLFWSNSNQHSYPELMSSLLQAHPAFFKHFVPTESPTAYVNSVHGDKLDDMLTLAENEGWKFIMMHKSWTATLQKRLHKD